MLTYQIKKWIAILCAIGVFAAVIFIGSSL
jgi:hypothetical protein